MAGFRISSCCGDNTLHDVDPASLAPSVPLSRQSSLLDPELAMLGRQQIPLSNERGRFAGLFRAARQVMLGSATTANAPSSSASTSGDLPSV